jgi:hypothetical protein
MNIVNPELWYKLYGYKGKLTTEYIKFDYEKDKIRNKVDQGSSGHDHTDSE